MRSEKLKELFERYPRLEKNERELTESLKTLLKSFESGGKLLCCGDGGSAADCDHLVGELMKGFLKKRPLTDLEKAAFDDEFLSENLQKALPAISLCAHSALITAFGNDVEPSLVFAQQVYAYAKKEDVLICFSSSGFSENVVRAAGAAAAAGIPVISITGEKESPLSELSSVCVRLPENETFKVQELTLPVYHWLAAEAEAKFFEI